MSGEPALGAAKEDGFLIVHLGGGPTGSAEAIGRHKEAMHSTGRAEILVLVGPSGLAGVVYAPPSGPSHAGHRLRDAARRLGDGQGLNQFAFEHWTSRMLDGDAALVLAAELWRLDRHARSPDGAAAFERSDEAARRWVLASEVMET